MDPCVGNAKVGELVVQPLHEGRRAAHVEIIGVKRQGLAEEVGADPPLGVIVDAGRRAFGHIEQPDHPHRAVRLCHQCGDLLIKRPFGQRARGDEQEGLPDTALAQPFEDDAAQHCQHRCDPDTRGKQNGRARFERVDDKSARWRARLDHVADCQVIMQVVRDEPLPLNAETVVSVRRRG